MATKNLFIKEDSEYPLLVHLHIISSRQSSPNGSHACKHTTKVTNHASCIVRVSSSCKLDEIRTMIYAAVFAKQFGTSMIASNWKVAKKMNVSVSMNWEVASLVDTKLKTDDDLTLAFELLETRAWKGHFVASLDLDAAVEASVISAADAKTFVVSETGMETDEGDHEDGHGNGFVNGNESQNGGGNVDGDLAGSW